MILLDSCVLLEILWDEKDAAPLATFLDSDSTQKTGISIPRIVLLECATVIAVRNKQIKPPSAIQLEKDINALWSFAGATDTDGLDIELFKPAARTKYDHGASMVDCYLIAMARAKAAAILTGDGEILNYRGHEAHITKISKHFSMVQWVSV